MRSDFVKQAKSLNLGIPYNHHAYFAGAVHQRNEPPSSNSNRLNVYSIGIPLFGPSLHPCVRMVLLADVGEGCLAALTASVAYVACCVWCTAGRSSGIPSQATLK